MVDIIEIFEKKILLERLISKYQLRKSLSIQFLSLKTTTKIKSKIDFNYESLKEQICSQ